MSRLADFLGTEAGEFAHRVFKGDFRAFADEMHNVAAEMWELARPMDDPPGIIAFHHGVTLSLWMPPPQAWNDADSKEALIEGVAVPLARKMQASKVAVLSAAWIVTSNSPSGKRVRRLQQQGKPIPSFASLPERDRKEVVMLTVIDPEIHEGHLAPVRRRRSAHPLLGAWEVNSGRDGTLEMSGLMVDPLQEALR
jgi:hypothetical protein